MVLWAVWHHLVPQTDDDAVAVAVCLTLHDVVEEPQIVFVAVDDCVAQVALWQILAPLHLERHHHVVATADQVVDLCVCGALRGGEHCVAVAAWRSVIPPERHVCALRVVREHDASPVGCVPLVDEPQRHIDVGRSVDPHSQPLALCGQSCSVSADLVVDQDPERIGVDGVQSCACELGNLCHAQPARCV